MIRPLEPPMTNFKKLGKRPITKFEQIEEEEGEQNEEENKEKNDESRKTTTMTTTTTTTTTMTTKTTTFKSTGSLTKAALAVSRFKTNSHRKDDERLKTVIHALEKRPSKTNYNTVHDNTTKKNVMAKYKLVMGNSSHSSKSHSSSSSGDSAHLSSFQRQLLMRNEPVAGYGRRIYEKDEIFQQKSSSANTISTEKRRKNRETRSISSSNSPPTLTLKAVKRHPQTFGIWDKVYDLSVIETLPPVRTDHLTATFAAKTDHISEEEDDGKPHDDKKGEDVIVNDDEEYCKEFREMALQNPRKNSLGKYLTEDDFRWCLKQTKFSNKEIIRWYKNFRIDCPRGQLTKSHLSRLFRKLMPNENNDRFVNQIFRIFDNDNNGYLDFKEFLMAMAVTKCESPMDRLHWAFKLYDVDGNGSIDLKEMTMVIEIVDKLEGRCFDGKTSEKKAKELYNAMDFDHDGCITFEEFVRFFDVLKGEIS